MRGQALLRVKLYTGVLNDGPVKKSHIVSKVDFIRYCVYQLIFSLVFSVFRCCRVNAKNW